MTMSWTDNDGGRAAAGYKGDTGDCATRAISIAASTDYQEVYALINEAAKSERRKNKSHARTGVHMPTMRKVLEDLGWKWTPTMTIGSGCQVHLRPEELPEGRIIVRLSRHYAAVIDGVLHDTHDCSREGTRCVYGYWRQAA